MSPNNRMQRSGTDKVHAPHGYSTLDRRGCALQAQRAVADARRYATLALIALLLSLSTYVLPASVTPREATTTDLRSQLLELGRKDQEIRDRQWPALLESPSPEFLAMAAEMSRIDADNLRALEQIIAKHGWPRSQDVGAEASDVAWLILQHSPSEIQEKYFPLLQAAVTTGSIRADHVAMLEDRILVSQKKRQKYGTQVVTDANGEPEVYPVENPAELATLRESVGMPPMAEYLRRGEEDIGRPIGRGIILPKDAEAPAK
jgi:hypothetical protein